MTRAWFFKGPAPITSGPDKHYQPLIDLYESLDGVNGFWIEGRFVTEEEHGAGEAPEGAHGEAEGADGGGYAGRGVAEIVEEDLEKGLTDADAGDADGE